MEHPMKKILIATAVTLMCSSALAQTGPAAQGDNMTKPGTMEKNSMDKGSMDRGSMDKGSMSNTTGMDKGNPKKEMSKDGSPAAGSKDTMKK
jgi:pentapeptide MXKDX repeat protein